MQNFDYIILGGGISGLTFGRLLQQHTNKKFIILEKENSVGGLCRSGLVNGDFVDTGGGHFLHSKYQEVYDFVFSHVPEDRFNKLSRNTKIMIHGTSIDYPIEQNIWQFTDELALQYVSSMVDALATTSTPSTFEGWMYKNLGKEICDNYLIPYNRKIWGVEPNELSTEWLNKVPRVDLKEVLRSIIYKQGTKGVEPSHGYYYYPKDGGFGIIPDAIYDSIREHVTLHEPAESLVHMLGRWYVNDIYSAPRIINTVPWPVLPICIKNEKQHPLVSGLKHNSIVVSFCPVENYEFPDTHWRYIPDENIAAHREFYVSNYAVGNKQKYIALETNVKRYTRELKIPGAFSYFNEYAYPIPTHNLRRDMNHLLQYFAHKNIFGLGRWGQWQYYNSDVCIWESMQLLKQLENVKIPA